MSSLISLYLTSFKFLQSSVDEPCSSKHHPHSLTTFFLVSKTHLDSSFVPQLFQNYRFDEDERSHNYKRSERNHQQLSIQNLEVNFPCFSHLLEHLLIESSTLQFASTFALNSDVASDKKQRQRIITKLFEKNLGLGRYWSRSLKHFKCKSLDDETVEMFAYALTGKTFLANLLDQQRRHVNTSNKAFYLIKEKGNKKPAPPAQPMANYQFPIALESLDLGNSSGKEFSDYSLKFLAENLAPKLHHLKYFSLRRCNGLNQFISDSYSYIQAFGPKTLRHLVLADLKNLNDYGLPSVNKYTNLTHLDVSGSTKIKEIWYGIGSYCPPVPLRVLNLGGTSVTCLEDSGKDVERENIYARDIISGDTDDTDDDEDSSSGEDTTDDDDDEQQPDSSSSTVKEISFRNCADFEHLFSCGRLARSITSLDISGTKFSLTATNNQNELSRFTNLKVLKISACRKLDLYPTRNSVKFLKVVLSKKSKKSLEELDISHNPEIDVVAQLGALGGKCPNFKKLNVSWCEDIVDDELGSLANIFPDLEWLNLEGSSDITDEGIVDLASLRKLTYLNICSCPGITMEGVKALEKKLPDLKIEHYADAENENLNQMFPF